MRNYFWNRIFLVLFFIISYFSCDEFSTRKNIIGTWVGVYEGNNVIFRIKNNGTCTLTFQNNNIDNYSISGDYEIDFTKRPIPITIRNIPGLPHPLHTIVEFIGGESIKMGMFSKRWRLRPISFYEGQVIYLNKLK